MGISVRGKGVRNGRGAGWPPDGQEGQPTQVWGGQRIFSVSPPGLAPKWGGDGYGNAEVVVTGRARLL